MAKYKVTHRCGHAIEISLFGSMKDREWRMAQMRHEDCAKCRAKVVAEADNVDGLPALVGTEKQIAWASDIRRDRLPQMQAAAEKAQAKIDRVRANMSDETQMAAVMANKGWTREEIERRFAAESAPLIATIDLYNTAKAQSGASWWIEHR